MKSGEQKYDVFFSHSHEDVTHVELLAHRVEHSGFRVWLDKWVLVPGVNWQQEITKGLIDTFCCAVFIGKNTPTGWFKQEIERALDRQAKDEQFRVMSVLLPGAEMKIVDSFLGLRTWVDFRKGIDDERQFHTLISGIKGVAPGKGPEAKPVVESEIPEMIRNQLVKIKNLLCEGLIDDEIAKEYRRKLVDRFLLEI